MHVDYLIVGQGISGTFLTYFLAKENKSFVVVDRNESITPSKVSAGIINPVTGRRLVKVWMAEEVISFAKESYSEIGNFLGLDAIDQKNLIDFFPNVHQREVFTKRIEEGDPYLHSFPEQNQFNSFFNYSLGCGEIRHCYVVHLEILLPAWSRVLKEQNKLLEEEFVLDRLVVQPDFVEWSNRDGQTIRAEKIIFCDGLSSFQNPFFSLLPFAPNKGEALIVEIQGLPSQHIYKKGFVLTPLTTTDQFWFGSNYHWNFDHAHPTKEFYVQAEAHLKAWLKTSFKILEHKASVRPATIERRPFVGLHPHQKNIGMLNGLGTKGCSLAPFFAKQFVDHLVHEKPLLPEADVKRFSRILGK